MHHCFNILNYQHILLSGFRNRRSRYIGKFFKLVVINHKSITKKNLFTLLALIFKIPTVLSQNQERLSVQFFYIPEKLESKFLKFNSEANTILENSVYGENFFKLFLIKTLSICDQFYL